MSFLRKSKIVAIIMIISMTLLSCAPSQKTIDNILPDYSKRMYSIADLIPYSFKELRNAQALYGVQLMRFFNTNTSTAAELKRVTKEEKNAFYKELRYRNTNYKLLRNRLSMYEGDELKSQEEKLAERQKEYNQYYKTQNAESGSIIKQYNRGRLDGMPLMSIRVDMSTATMSEFDDIYSEAECEIYKPVVIEEKVYQKLSIGDKIELEVPIENRTFDKKETKKIECTYIATDSLLYVDEDEKENYYYIADIDGTNDYCRRITDDFGKSVEVYVEKRVLQFMKNAMVARSAEPQMLMDSIANDQFIAYNFDALVIRAMGGGYYEYDYKDYIFANSITTNLKGYITALYDYSDLALEIEYYQKKY